jgi:hypothetical protein
MKKLTALFTLLFLCCITACNQDDFVPDSCIEVRMVASYCTRAAVLQIVTPEAQSFGETWTDNSGTTFDNVFRTILPCGFDHSVADGNKTFFIQLSDTLEESLSCAHCSMLVSGLPETFSYIKKFTDCGSLAD